MKLFNVEEPLELYNRINSRLSALYKEMSIANPSILNRIAKPIPAKLPSPLKEVDLPEKEPLKSSPPQAIQSNILSSSMKKLRQQKMNASAGNSIYISLVDEKPLLSAIKESPNRSSTIKSLSIQPRLPIFSKKTGRKINEKFRQSMFVQPQQSLQKIDRLIKQIEKIPQKLDPIKKTEPVVKEINPKTRHSARDLVLDEKKIGVFKKVKREQDLLLGQLITRISRDREGSFQRRKMFKNRTLSFLDQEEILLRETVKKLNEQKKRFVAITKHIDTSGFTRADNDLIQIINIILQEGTLIDEAVFEEVCRLFKPNELKSQESLLLQERIRQIYLDE